ncbi:MAG: hypothetical protein HY744_13690 [Deltaproteobacteria bacterium]|nr:hypothetical protein [Deltaproteobacteria bacterium]
MSQPLPQTPPPDEDPVLRSLREAPLDDEPETEEERAAIEEGLEDVRAGRLIPHEEVRRRWLGEK